MIFFDGKVHMMEHHQSITDEKPFYRNFSTREEEPLVVNFQISLQLPRL